MTAYAPKPPLLGTAREWAIDLLVGAGIGLLLGLMGPFGSFFNDSLPLRIAYWIGGMLSGFLLFGCLTRLAAAGARRVGAPDWAMIPVVILLGSAIQGPPLRAVAITLWPQIAQRSRRWPGTASAWRPRRRSSSSTTSCVCGPRVRIAGPLVPVEAPAPAADPGAVLYLRMEDHYVRIRTEHGSRLEMGPLARVTAGLGRVEGLQTHRSWWVARRAITGVERDGRNLRLTADRRRDGPRQPRLRGQAASRWLAGRRKSRLTRRGRTSRSRVLMRTARLSMGEARTSSVNMPIKFSRRNVAISPQRRTRFDLGLNGVTAFGSLQAHGSLGVCGAELGSWKGRLRRLRPM
jgi:hypothetical protein